jgi:ketosteroid isomerase-like protein
MKLGASGQLSTVVTGYYRSIDDGNLESALACFAPHAVYRRPGYDAFIGFDAIIAFYRLDRVIAAGRHVLESIVEVEDTVAVRGSFRGTSRAGSPVALRFADFWRFTDGGVIERNTYFDAPVA